jgi:hypothetical protein
MASGCSVQPDHPDGDIGEAFLIEFTSKAIREDSGRHSLERAVRIDLSSLGIYHENDVALAL